MEAPRWLADEMLGRLARYLRFLGHDTEYVRGLSDAEIADRAALDGRRLLTRDQGLAARVTGAVLITSTSLQEQLRQVRAAAPAASYSVRFDRCTVCNGELVPWTRPEEPPWPEDVPRALRADERSIFECRRCRHHYWEGSHTAHVRRDVEVWLAG